MWLTQLLNPGPGEITSGPTRGELAAEGHARLSSPLYALTAMTMALAALLGGGFSRTGYTTRIAKASAAFLVVRVIGYGLAAASAWNGWLNVLQYLAPIIFAGLALRILFRDVRTRRSLTQSVKDMIGARLRTRTV